jgi:hypothetical protein
VNQWVSVLAPPLLIIPLMKNSFKSMKPGFEAAAVAGLCRSQRAGAGKVL